MATANWGLWNTTSNSGISSTTWLKLSHIGMSILHFWLWLSPISGSYETPLICIVISTVFFLCTENFRNCRPGRRELPGTYALVSFREEPNFNLSNLCRRSNFMVAVLWSQPVGSPGASARTARPGLSTVFIYVPYRSPTPPRPRTRPLPPATRTSIPLEARLGKIISFR